MEKITKALKYSFLTVFGITILILFWLLSSIYLPEIKVNENFVSCIGGSSQCLTVYLRSNGMHTEVVFPVVCFGEDWRKRFPIAQFEGVDSTFTQVAIGWGDKGFYLETPTWDELKVSTALKATVGASGSAMHVTYLQSPPSTKDEYGKELHISKEQYMKMYRYIDQAFKKDEQGKDVQIPHPDYDIHDNYYEARGSYNLFKTCNVWTSNCLKTAGIQNGLWTPTAKGVMKSLPD